MRKGLKIRILMQYPTQREFALTIRKPEDWLSKIIHVKIDPNEKEKRLIMKALGIKDERDLFLDWE